MIVSGVDHHESISQVKEKLMPKIIQVIKSWSNIIG